MNMGRRALVRTRTRRWSLVIGSALAASAGQVQAQEWTKHFRIGMQLAVNIDAEFSMGGQFNVPFQQGVYDDGYVRVDDLGSPNGDTTFWGYQNASQYNGTDTLTFHRIESFEVTSSQANFSDDPYIGMELAYGGPIRRWRQALLGWEVGYSFLPIHISDRRALSADIGQLTALHDTTGVVIPEPPPYEGGPSGVEQPGISLNPSGQPSFSIVPGEVTGPRALDVSLHNLRFGPTLHYEFARRWAVQGSAGGALGFVTGDYRFDETLTPGNGGASSRNTGKIGVSDFVYGAYVNGVILFHVEEHGDIYAGVQFMTMSDSEVTGEGRRARLNLGAAFSFLVGVNWPF